MATLEKIRQKSVLLVSVIGVALVLFIITLVDNPFAMFQDTTSIAKVGGHKISIEEFNRRAEMASQQQQQQNGGSSVDNAVLQAQVLQQMVTEALINDEYDKLGLTVTPQELTEAMVGETAHPYMSQWAAQFGTTPRQLYDMIFTPAQYGIDPQAAEQFKAQWIQMENAIEDELKSAKFQTLLGGSIVANKLDAKAMFDENAKTYQIAYAKTDLYTVPDSVANVSDADMRALYKEHKEEYALPEPARLVTYVNLPIVASAQDRLAAQQAVENALVALREQPAMEGIAGQSAFITKRVEAPESTIAPAALKTFLSEASVNDVDLVSSTGTVMEIAKLLGKSSKVDELTYDMVGINTDEVSVDSIMPLLKAAAEIDSVAGVTGSQKAQTVTLSTSGIPANEI
ncbi:MAG: SurA N-terminal domain-containing protein [Muribaculaceae bacterium]|nr:SurA N-terminal domain-containing protein [Muribaculaceae bacterium]